ncbi:Hypoxia up-regulated protein 1 [Entophlyctis sp. JEL0112]|nr:Hypoxia up-regulated protein 1 [Entophlyctis sp. JEL0112]
MQPRIVLFALALALRVGASVIGIDYGTDWFKVAIVKPGIPLDIVLNKESKRKTDSVVALKDGVRFFGSDAAALYTRYPDSTFPAIKNLLGLPFGDPIAADYRDTYASAMVAEPVRSTCAFITGNATYTVEELLAMQLAHAKRQAEIAGGESVSGAVITVPAYLTHYERQAIVDAAEIAGLKLLQLMNDGTAVALNFATSRTITEPQHHIFFDMGAGSTSVTLARFSSVKVKKTQTPVIEILAVGHDRTLGGRAIDIKLRDHLARLFMDGPGKKAETDVRTNARSMARLLKEATRVKQILSANADTVASIEGVHEDIDFKAKVTRKELEDIIGKDYFKKLTAPIKEALKAASLPLEKLDSLVLVGGAVRIPAVQAELKSLVGEEKIAKNVNGDEANVLGAGFRAASMSRQFKVKEIKIKESPQHAIEISYPLEPGSSNQAASTARTVLFATNTTLPSKKLMNFKRVSDFDFKLGFRPSEGSSDPSVVPILTAKVTGLTEAISARQETYESVKVQAQVALNDGGIVGVEHANAVFELKTKELSSGGGIAESVLNFFGGKKDKEKEKVGEKGNSESETSETKSEATKTNKNDKTTDTKSSASSSSPESKKVTTEKVKLAVDISYETLPPLTEEFKEAARKRFAVMDEQDAARRAREEAYNALEAFIYSTQDFLESADILTVSTAEQRVVLAEKTAAVQTWLESDADDAVAESSGATASTDTLRAQLKALKAVRAPLYHRVHELARRPAAVAAFRRTLADAEAFVASVQLNNSTPDHAFYGLYTDADFETARTRINDAATWIDDAEARHAATPVHEPPAFKAADVDARRSELESVIVRMFVKQPPKKTKTTSTSKSTSSSSASADSTSFPTPETQPPSSSQEEQPERSSEDSGIRDENQNAHDEL